MTTTRRDRWTTRTGLLLGVLATAAAILAFGAGTATAATASTGKATASCWKNVVNDWLQHEPNVVGTYPIACYRQALQHLNDYSDLKQYSSAADDIRRAMLLAIKNDKNGGGGSNGSGGGSGSGGSSSGGSGGGGGSGTGTPAPHKSIITRLFDSVGPGNAQSIPLPLLVLAGLAILLLLAALGTWLAKRIQARRMTPAPAPSPVPPKHP
jgi:ABC-type transport system substrate-binding protein